MPELPELQALAERLDDLLGGSTLTSATVMQFSAAKTYEPPLESFAGRDVGRVGRRGKYLIFDFSGPRLVVHLSQGGRVDIELPPKASRPKGAVLRLVFDERVSVLLKEYGTERKAALWALAAGEQGPLSDLGPEPFSEELRGVVMNGTDRRRLHTLLRDQRTVAGIGRGYADDILHRARLSPYATLAKLDERERAALLEAIEEVLKQALETERRRTGGLPAKLASRFSVHRRHGEACPECSAVLQRISYDSYEVTYCPHCQTRDQVLADRRLSRLVR